MMRVCVFETRYGWIGLAGSNGRLSRCALPRQSRREALDEMTAGLGEDAVEDDAAFGDLPDKLRSYFEGKRVDFSDTPTNLSRMPEFTARVLKACQAIPYGQRMTYAELARKVGAPNAVRAVGNAMARNLMPIIIPCHRVVASNGRLGGFSAGIDWKRRLLRIEGI